MAGTEVGILATSAQFAAALISAGQNANNSLNQDRVGANQHRPEPP